MTIVHFFGYLLRSCRRVSAFDCREVVDDIGAEEIFEKKRADTAPLIATFPSQLGVNTRILAGQVLVNFGGN